MPVTGITVSNAIASFARGEGERLISSVAKHSELRVTCMRHQKSVNLTVIFCEKYLELDTLLEVKIPGQPPSRRSLSLLIVCPPGAIQPESDLITNPDLGASDFLSAKTVEGDLDLAVVASQAKIGFGKKKTESSIGV